MNTAIQLGLIAFNAVCWFMVGHSRSKTVKAVCRFCGEMIDDYENAHSNPEFGK